MKRIIIKPITNNGEEAIKKYITECRELAEKNPIKTKIIEKSKKKLGIHEEYYENPFIIEITLKKNYYMIEQPIISKIEQILKKYNANNTDDYIIEVHND